MGIEVVIRAAPKEDGDPCLVFDPVYWWRGRDLMGDSRFRVIDPAYFYSIACLSGKEMIELQERFRPRAEGLDHWKLDSDRLDSELGNPRNNGRWWVVSVFEWDRGLDVICEMESGDL